MTTDYSALPTVTLTPPAGGHSAIFALSLPLPHGLLPAGTDIGLTGLPTQSRPLASWPDGSIRWLHILGLNQDETTADWCSSPVEPNAPAWIRAHDDGDLELGTEDLHLLVRAAGSSPIVTMTLAGEALLAEDGLQAELVYADGRTARFAGDAVSILEPGPVRATARWEGIIDGDEVDCPLQARLDISVTAGLPDVKLSLQVSHQTPGLIACDIASLSLSCHTPGATGRQHVWQKNRGMLCLSQDIATHHPVEIRVITDHSRAHAVDPTCFEDPESYPETMPDIMDHSCPVVGVENPRGWLDLSPIDFCELMPAGLRAANGALTWDMLPNWGEQTHLRQGRARRFETVLLPSPAGEEPPSATALERRREALRDLGSVRLPLDWYRRHAGFGADRLLHAEPLSPRRFDRYLRGLGLLPTVMGVWDLGDTIDSGYTGTYAANHSTRRLPGPPQPRFTAGGHNNLATWSLTLAYEPVWANNEYDAILALGREWIRTEPAPHHWTRLCWFSRHAIEVDFVHYADHWQFHHGTPAHSADHQRATAYPSHLWCEGLLLYYALSGDDDALDVAIKQGDFIINAFANPDMRKRIWGFSRELGWALLYLATVADFTGEQRFVDGADELASFLASHEMSPATYAAMAATPFAYGSLSLGIHATWQLNGNPVLAAWLEKVSREMARQILEMGAVPTESTMTLLYFSAAYEVSGDVSHLEPGLHILERFMESPQWVNPRLETKPVAMLHRSLATWLGPAHRHGLLEGLDYRFYPGSGGSLPTA